MRGAFLITAFLGLVNSSAFAQDGGVGIQAGPPSGNAPETKATDTSKHKSLKVNIVCNGGIGLPLGKFSTSYYERVSSNGVIGNAGFDGRGGFAQAGPVFDILAESPIKETWGVAAQLGFNMNKFNMADYAYGYNYISPVYYRSFSIMPGAYAEFADDKLSFELRAMAGVLISRSPELQYSGDSIYADLINSRQDTANIFKDTKPVVAIAFAFDLGISLKFNLSSKMMLAINADYEQAYPTYFTSQVYKQNGAGISSFRSIYCPVSLFNATIGIGYRFGK